MAKKIKEAGRTKKLIMASLVFGPALILIFVSTLKCEHKFTQLDYFGDIPSYQATTIDGKTITNETFKGKVVIYTVLNESCPKDCAISIWDVNQQLFRKLKENPGKLRNVKIVSFVVDKDGNPVEDLENMRKILEYNVLEYNPEIWILAKGDANNLYNIEHNKHNLSTIEGDEYFNGKAYYSLLLLADQDNKLRMVLKGDSESMVRKFHQYMTLLIKQNDKERFKRMEAEDKK